MNSGISKGGALGAPAPPLRHRFNVQIWPSMVIRKTNRCLLREATARYRGSPQRGERGRKGCDFSCACICMLTASEHPPNENPRNTTNDNWWWLWV